MVIDKGKALHEKVNTEDALGNEILENVDVRDMRVGILVVEKFYGVKEALT